MKKIININTVCQCNKLVGEKTLHPQVSVIDISKINIEDLDTLQVDFYSIILKEEVCQHTILGRKEYDYCDGTIIFLTPGEIIDIKKSPDSGISKGQMLIFHSDLLKGTFLDKNINEYPFFNYNTNESLHISMREKRVFMQCIENIKEELHRSIDKHSHLLVAKSIDLLLGYCSRFYERQFITRSEENKQLIKKIDKYIYSYFASDSTIKDKGLLSTKYCSELFHLSTAYFNELLKQETGHSFDEYVQVKRISIAKKWLNEKNKTIAEIVYTLGFPSPEYFNQLFKKLTGSTPKGYLNSKTNLTH